mgnify:CR=1 FL=1
MLADGEADARLLFVAHQRQMGVEQVEGRVEFAVRVKPAHLDQHLGIAITRHGAIRATGKLFGEEYPAISRQDADPATTAGFVRL